MSLSSEWRSGKGEVWIGTTKGCRRSSIAKLRGDNRTFLRQVLGVITVPLSPVPTFLLYVITHAIVCLGEHRVCIIAPKASDVSETRCLFRSTFQSSDSLSVSRESETSPSKGGVETWEFPIDD